MASDGITSMTGFGRGSANAEGIRAAVEIRSVNRRYLRVDVKIPPAAASLAPCLREIVESGVRRGQVDAMLRLDGVEALSLALPDAGLVRAYVEAWRRIGGELGLDGAIDVGTLAAMPGTFAAPGGDDLAERARPAAEAAAREALEALKKMRRAEGESLGRDLAARVDTLEATAGRIAARADDSKREHVRKLKERVESLLAEIGASVEESVLRPNLEREIVFHADRTDVSEELERTASHLDQFRAALDAGGPAGRKFEFIVQELQREISTLGAKVADAEAGREALEFKSELARIREQVQNVE